MVHRRLGQLGPVSPIGFGAFKIGRNAGTKYPAAYDLPSDEASARLLNGVLDLGINYIDTAPAYGSSEDRIGAALAHRRSEFILSTKAGETFENGTSHHDYSSSAIRRSVQSSLRRLRTDLIDILFIHSDGRDRKILEETDAVAVLHDLRATGLVRAIGFSGKTAEGARAALSWADVIMVPYHLEDRSHEEVIEAAGKMEVGVVVKKGLASGHLAAADAISFVLGNAAVSSLVIGGLDLEHIRANVTAATERREAESRKG